MFQSSFVLYLARVAATIAESHTINMDLEQTYPRYANEGVNICLMVHKISKL